MDNSDFLATQMTQTYFLIMPDQMKKHYLTNPKEFDNMYITKYEQSKNSIALQQNNDAVMKPFGEDENSLNSAIIN